MRTTSGSLLASTLLLLGVSGATAAQTPTDGSAADFWRWALAEVRGADEGRQAVAAARGAPGPAFCRSGVGHPVRGRAWCVQQGFGLGRLPWVRFDGGGLRLGESDRSPRFDGRLGASELEAILGPETLVRLLGRAGVDASPSFLNGRWQRAAGPRDARILQIRVVDRPLAEINDLDADGRADAILLYRPGR